MSKITSEVTTVAAITDVKGVTETLILKSDSPLLSALHTSVVLALGYSAVESLKTMSGSVECETPLVHCLYNVGIRDGKITIIDSTLECELDVMEVVTNVLRPFLLVTPDLVPLINEHSYDHNGVHCWLLEDLTGYYSGNDSDIWILTDDGKLIVTEEYTDHKRAATRLRAVEVFDINKPWANEEVNNSELIQGIIDASY